MNDLERRITFLEIELENQKRNIEIQRFFFSMLISVSAIIIALI